MIEVNMQPTDISSIFYEHRVGKAGTEVPQLISELLAQQ
jgi:hypothetical protein